MSEPSGVVWQGTFVCKKCRATWNINIVLAAGVEPECPHCGDTLRRLVVTANPNLN